MAVTVKAYCMRCKAKKGIEGPKKSKMKNGCDALKGTCADCGTKVFAILPKS